MLFLDLFPIPRRYERIPGALAFAFVAAMVIVRFNENEVWATALLGASAVLLILVYALRIRHKKEWLAFHEEENRRLLAVKGARGPAAYIPIQREVVKKHRNPELKISAQLNLCSVLLVDGRPDEAERLLAEMIPPEKMPNPTLRLVYWTQKLRVALQRWDEDGSEYAYQKVMDTLPEVSDVLKVSFMPYEIHYQLVHGEFELALNQLNEIPTENLDEASSDLLKAYRVIALRGLGVTDKAEKLCDKVRAHDLLPSTRQLLDVELVDVEED